MTFRDSRLRPCALAVASGLLLGLAACERPSARPAAAGPPAGPEETPIAAIQGPGPHSPLAGRTVTTRGVVTLLSADGASFWIQDPTGDGHPATSEGIYVAGGGFPPEGPRPRVGDLVRVRARVDELQFGNALPLTRLTQVSRLERLASGQPLPAPVTIEALPDERIAEAIAFWEPLEGMRVALRDARVVGPTSRFGELALLAPGNARPGSGFFATSGYLLVRPLGEGEVDYNPERILVDDISLEVPLRARVGDVLEEVVGVVHYTYGNYKLEPERWRLVAQPPPALPAPPAPRPTVATVNVENLFDPVDDPATRDEATTPTEAELEVKLAKLTRLLQSLGLPRIVAVQEVENTAILERLARQVNTAAGTAYRAVSRATSDRRGIETGFLWDAASVALEGVEQLAGPAVARAFGPRSPSPGREPLVGTFALEGQTLVVVNVHFKSKGGDDPLFGTRWPPLRPTEIQRRDQARVVRAYVETLLADPEALVLVAGDFNDFPFPEPGEGPEHPLAILRGGTGQVPLQDLLVRVPEAERFTFVYEGNAQVLDGLWASPALARRVQAVGVLHLNAGFPQSWSRDPTTPFRASDHDPVWARFAL